MASLIFNKIYEQLSVKLMSPIYSIIKNNFGDDIKHLEPVLKQTNMHTTVEEYLSVALLTTLLVIIFSGYFFSIVFATVFDFRPIIVFLLTIALSLIGLAASISFFYTYPTIKLNAIRRGIELNLPYMTTHMSTIAGTGVPLPMIFELVGQFKEYGVLAQECRKIARNTEVFGMDILTALNESAANTPSPHFKELLWAMISTIRSGGNLRELLVQKGETFLKAQELTMSAYVDFLGVLSEIYIIGFVSAPLFIIILVTVMSLITTLPIAPTVLLSIIIYILLPIAYTIFLIVIKLTRPVGV